MMSNLQKYGLFPCKKCLSFEVELVSVGDFAHLCLEVHDISWGICLLNSIYSSFSASEKGSSTARRIYILMLSSTPKNF